MQWIEGDFQSNPMGLRDCSLTIGNFDGIHLGHRALIKAATERGGPDTGPSVLLTFSPHPSHVLSVAEPVPLIYPKLEKRALLEKMGLDYVCVQSFTEDFSKMPSWDFLNAYVRGNWAPRCLVIGDDFGFGKSKSGGETHLKSFCESTGCELVVPDTQIFKGQRASSSRIRDCLREGDVMTAAEVLGAPFHLSSVVVKGQQLGRKLGYPTANMKLSSRLYPQNGVYGVRVHWEGESYMGVANIGTRPTVDGDAALSFECHILDFSESLYGETLRIEFLMRIRPEKRFESLDALKQQIEQDILEFKNWRIEKS